MQLSWFEAVLTFTFVEEVRLELPTGVFFCGRHYISPLVKLPGVISLEDFNQQWSNPAVFLCVSSIPTSKKLQHSDAFSSKKKKKDQTGVELFGDEVQIFCLFSCIQLLLPNK